MRIDTDRYPIYLDANEAYPALKKHCEEKGYSSIFLLMDDHTQAYCLPRFKELAGLDIKESIVIKHGELNKNMQSLEHVLLELSEYGADRKSLLINLGGGVVTDMGGFAASIFKRGIDFVNIPTTLLSMVDASVGGKTGVDLEALKNQVGTFAFPELIIVDAEYLETLPQRELTSGFAEMLKHGLIQSETLWEQLKPLNPTVEVLAPFIPDSIMVKKEVVENDPYEGGLRKILNFGHTIGHAVESHYLNDTEPYLHGEAIAIGMITEAYLSAQKNALPLEVLQEITDKLMQTYSLKPIAADRFEDIMTWMKHDKKNKGSEIRFSLLDKLGSCKYDQVINEVEVLDALTYYNNLF